MRLKYLLSSPKPLFLKFLAYRQQQKFGLVLGPTHYWGRMFGHGVLFYLFYQNLMRRSSPLSQTLRTLVMARVSQVVECDFCIDFNTLQCKDLQTTPAKIEHLHNWQDNTEHYTPAEQAALLYAQAMCEKNTPEDASCFEALQTHFSEVDILELTALVAFQNLSARFNRALHIPSQGLCVPSSTKEPST